MTAPTKNQDSSGPWRVLLTGWTLLLAIAVLAAGLRLYVMERTFPVRLVGDELHYVDTATNIALGRGHRSNLRSARAATPPLHPYLLSRFVDPTRPPVDTTRSTPRQGLDRYVQEHRVKSLLYVQVVLGTLLVGLTAFLGWALFDRRTGLLAALVAAVYPTFVAYSHYLWSSLLFTVLVTGGLIGVVWEERLRRWPLAAATGLAFGLSGLTRELGLGIAAASALWWVVTAAPPRRRRAVAHAALMLLCASLVILPWTYRNYSLFQRLIPVSTIGWMATAEGNILEGPSWFRPNTRAIREFRRDYFAIQDEMERSDEARRVALVSIAAEQPTWFFKKLPRNLALLFSPDSMLFRKLGMGAYGDVSPGLRRALLLATLLSYVAVIVFALLGAAAVQGRRRWALPGLVVSVSVMLHVVANASSRYRLPLMPLLIVYASHGLLGGPSRLRHLSRCRIVTVTVVLLGFFGLCVPYFYSDALALWSRGSYVEADRQ